MLEIKVKKHGWHTSAYSIHTHNNPGNIEEKVKISYAERILMNALRGRTITMANLFADIDIFFVCICPTNNSSLATIECFCVVFANTISF